MRIFLAGASGVLGSRLVPLLTRAGHEVVGMTRSPSKTEILRALGAEPVVCDVYDAAALRDAVVAATPELVMFQLTDLPDAAADLPAHRDANNRIRREGLRNLLAAREAAGGQRFLAQSVAWELSGDGGDAIADLEEATLGAEGVVVRYGQFFGPGTFYEDGPPQPPRIHIDEAARRTVPLVDAPLGVITLVEAAPPHS